MKIWEAIFFLQDDWISIESPEETSKYLKTFLTFTLPTLIIYWPNMSFVQRNNIGEVRIIWKDGTTEFYTKKGIWHGTVFKKLTKSQLRHQKYPRSHYWPKDLERIL